MRNVTIGIEGMHCGGCAGRVQRVLEAEDGVDAVEVSLEEAEARVRYRGDEGTSGRLREAIERAGYRPVPAAEE